MKRAELRLLADYLWDGEVRAVQIMGQLQAFNRFDEILYWLARNHIRGKKMIDFFNDAEGNETRGVLRGVKKIYNYIDSDKFNTDPLTTKELRK